MTLMEGASLKGVHSLKAGIHSGQRAEFKGENTVETKFVHQHMLEVRVVDLAGAGFMAAGDISNVDIADDVRVPPEGVDQIALHQLHMIDVIRPLFDNLRSMTVKYEFQNEEEEIHFFKDIKPDILSRYLYFYKITRIEMKRPIGSDDVQREYLHCQLDNLKYFFDQNLDFYQYYRSKATHLDSYYFVRYKANFRLCVDSAFLDKDPAFSTGYDYKVAKILSNEMLRIYLNRQLQLLDRKMQISKIRAALSDFNLKWTGSKSDAVEFGYGLVAIATLNNGNVTIKEIMAFIEAAFDIDLGDYYRTYLTLKSRKKNRTAFFTSVIEQLLKRMESDEL